MRNAAAKTVWPLSEIRSATSMAPVGGYGCIFVLIAPAGAVLVAQIVLIVSEDGETTFAALCFAEG